MMPLCYAIANPDRLNRIPWVAKVIVFLSLLFIMGLVPSYAICQPSNLDKSGLIDSFTAKGDIRRFAGETLYYDISFLWFSSAATAEVGMYEKDGQYYATLQAKTKGFVGFFTNNREHIYETQFEVLNDGQRLRAKSFKRKTIIGSHIKSSEHFFDYETRQHTWKKFNYSDLIEVGKEAIPAGINFDDVLTVFYNTRNSVYGPLEKGANYTIHTIPKKGNKKILVKILGEEEEKKQWKIEGKDPSQNWLFDIIVPKEVFITESGKLRFWSSKHLIPMETNIQDYILLGVLIGVLRGRTQVYNSQSPFIISPNLASK